MLEKYIDKGGKRLRYGYTTGSCAAAAAKGALAILIRQKVQHEVEIETPLKWNLKIDICTHEFNIEEASCHVVKDSGDDPDVTDGIEIYAKARWIENGILVKTGIGIGRVTRKGLSVEVGQPAINPVPMKMIKKEVVKILPKNKGVEITLWIPKGEAIAKKTFNPKLGIVGGISIIGTTGIVEPMSEDALKESLALEIKILAEEGNTSLIFTPGNYGLHYIRQQGLSETSLVKISNYVGDMLEKARDTGIANILFVGHAGKMTKLAAGVFQTHSKYADGRLETIAAYAGICGYTKETLVKILSSTTTDEAIEYVYDQRLAIYSYISQKAAECCRQRVHGDMNVEVIIFSEKFGFLGESSGAQKLMEGFKIETN
jgi:cobalt-precorrin-5B (C1)-methyltransferase